MHENPKLVRAMRPSRPVYVEVRKLVDPATGEEIGCLVPRYSCDRRALRDRGFAVGTELRCELKKARNPQFHRLAHAIGSLVVDQIPEFEGLDAHEAVKRLQRETGVCCESMEIDLGPLGKVPVSVPRSIAFDEMGEDEFQRLVQAIFALIARRYWPQLDAAGVEELVRMEMGR
jgi:hypothetical protein